MATTTNDGASHSSEFSDLACSTAQTRPYAIDNSDLINDATSEDSSIGTELLDTSRGDLCIAPRRCVETIIYVV
ncbi:hypothetical protein MKX03_032990, partial [Papaver bracteatum]